MENIPNQNNLYDIIKSQSEQLTDVMNTIIKSVDPSNAYMDKKIQKNINTFRDHMVIMFNKGGYIDTLNEYIKTFDEFTNSSNINNINKFAEKHQNIYQSINDIDDIIDLLKIIFDKQRLKELNNSLKNIDIIISVLDYIQIIFERMNTIIEDNSSKNSKINISILKNNINALTELLQAFQELFGEVKKTSRYKKIDENFEKIISTFANILKSIKDADVSVLLFLKIKSVRLIINNLLKLMDYISEKTKDVNNQSFVKGYIFLLSLEKIIDSIKTIMDNVENINLSPLFKLKFVFIKWAIKQMYSIISYLDKQKTNSSNIINSYITLIKLISVLNVIKILMDILNDTRVNIITILKLKLLKNIIHNINELIFSIYNIQDSANVMNGAIKTLLRFAVVIGLLYIILNTMEKIPAGILMRRKIRNITKCVRLINILIHRLNKLNTPIRATAKLQMLFIALLVLAKVFITTILLAPVAVGAMIAIWIIAGVLWVFAIAMRIILKIISFLTKPVVVISLLKLIGLLGLMVLLGLEMTILAITAIIVTKSFVSILLFLGALLLVTTLIIGIGYLAVIASPIIAPAAVGLLLIVMLVGIMVILALGLILLQTIELDPDQILANIDTIFNTVYAIIDKIFNYEDPDSKGSDKTWIGQLLKYSGVEMLINIAGMVLAVAFLAVSFAAVGIILLIAGALRLLQEIELDTAKIQTNVEIVIDTALSITKQLFEQKEEDSKQSNKSWYKSIIDFVSKPLSKIWDAVMAVGFLAVSLVSIQLILMMSVQLRLLQEINLQKDVINQNVTLVLDTANAIALNLFKREEENPTESTNNWFIDIINFIGAPIAKIFGSIMMIGYLAMTMISIYIIKLMAETLNEIQNINLNSDIISKKVSAITGAAQVTINVLKKSETLPNEGDSNIKALFRHFFPTAVGVVDAISNLKYVAISMISVGALKSLADLLVSINNTPDLSNISAKVTLITNATDKVIAAVSTADGKTYDFDAINKKLTYLERFKNIVFSISRLNTAPIKDVTDNCVKVLDKINSTDLNNLQTTVKLFEKLSNFSESINGNFEGLAESLNDKIAPLLEELKTLLEGVPSAINKGSTDISQSIVNNSLGPVDKKAATQNAGIFGNEGSQEYKDALARQQTLAKNRKDLEKYRSMQDIMDILLGQGAYTQGVKTH